MLKKAKEFLKRREREKHKKLLKKTNKKQALKNNRNRYFSPNDVIHAQDKSYFENATHIHDSEIKMAKQIEKIKQEKKQWEMNEDKWAEERKAKEERAKKRRSQAQKDRADDEEKRRLEILEKDPDFYRKKYQFQRERTASFYRSEHDELLERLRRLQQEQIDKDQKRERKERDREQTERERYRKNSRQPSSAHVLLGVSADASKAEMKKAYHMLVKQHHPDLMNHMSQKDRNAAENQLKKINRAWEQLK